jgi:hypothetical protein
VLAGLSALSFVSSEANSAIITYSSTSLGGNSWQYDYTVVNDTLGSPLEEFTIFFDLGSYDTIAIVGTPVGWDGLAIQPDAGNADDGSGDYLALTDGLSPGASQGGFVYKASLCVLRIYQ